MSRNDIDKFHSPFNDVICIVYTYYVQAIWVTGRSYKKMLLFKTYASRFSRFVPLRIKSLLNWLANEPSSGQFAVRLIGRGTCRWESCRLLWYLHGFIPRDSLTQFAGPSAMPSIHLHQDRIDRRRIRIPFMFPIGERIGLALTASKSTPASQRSGTRFERVHIAIL